MHIDSPATPPELPPWKRRVGSGSAGSGGFPVVEIFTPYGSEIRRETDRERERRSASGGRSDDEEGQRASSRPGSGGRDKVDEGGGRKGERP